MFAAGIYYALDEDQRGFHAREAFRRGMEMSKVAESGPTPTPFAAYLDAVLKNLEGDNAGARAALERAVKLEPRWQRPRFELGRMDAASGVNAAARSMLQDVLQREPEHAKAKALLAMVPDAVPAPHTTAPTVVPTQAEPTQVLPSATPESLKEPVPPRAGAVLPQKPTALPDVIPGPAPTPPPPGPRLPQSAAGPRPEPPPANNAPGNNVQKRLDALKQEMPTEPKQDNEPKVPPSDIQTPPRHAEHVRGTPPPFNPSDEKKAPPPPPPPAPPPSDQPESPKATTRASEERRRRDSALMRASRPLRCVCASTLAVMFTRAAYKPAPPVGVNAREVSQVIAVPKNTTDSSIRLASRIYCAVCISCSTAIRRRRFRTFAWRFCTTRTRATCIRSSSRRGSPKIVSTRRAMSCRTASSAPRTTRI